MILESYRRQGFAGELPAGFGPQGCAVRPGWAPPRHRAAPRRAAHDGWRHPAPGTWHPAPARY